MKSKTKNLDALFAAVHALVFDTCCINIVYSNMCFCKVSHTLNNWKLVHVQGQ